MYTGTKWVQRRYTEHVNHCKFKMITERKVGDLLISKVLNCGRYFSHGVYTSTIPKIVGTCDWFGRGTLSNFIRLLEIQGRWNMWIFFDIIQLKTQLFENNKKVNNDTELYIYFIHQRSLLRPPYTSSNVSPTFWSTSNWKDFLRSLKWHFSRDDFIVGTKSHSAKWFL